MDIVFIIGLQLCLLVVFYQDWKFRTIHILLPLLIFVLSLYILRHEIQVLFKVIIYNSVFFLFTLSILTIYMSIKNKGFLNPFQNYFGLGDLLFYLAITPLFLLQNYVLFFILSMIFAITVQLGLKKIMKHNTVPLAGFSALFLFIVIIKDMMLDFPKLSLL